jgi:hypothetical protein
MTRENEAAISITGVKSATVKEPVVLTLLPHPFFTFIIFHP